MLNFAETARNPFEIDSLKDRIISTYKSDLIIGGDIYEKNKKLPTSIEFEWFIKQRKFYFMNSLAPYKIKLLLSVDKNCLNKKLESI